ncbi:inner membrane protein [Burkholderia pseudomallei]|nr:inner membrane protein [Burkholderia pseudomallei]CAJ3480315.1 inner membrane protein [Burkholderia pseudomallei]CAJ3592712.1 inner membrane protein [Burkholderia pseudomallei]CAJ3642900.1 inner membrane protein [Burkholderia pseudomallei]CAJ3713336.1 inner membrane protein [Burkholderia pseudomallei]
MKQCGPQNGTTDNMNLTEAESAALDAPPAEWKLPCSEMKYIAKVANADGGHPAYLMKIKGAGEFWKEIEIPVTLTLSATQLARHLIEHGVELYSNDAPKHVADFLRTCHGSKIILRAERDGWIDCGQEPSYIFGKERFSDRIERVIRVEANARASAGTLADWNSLTALCCGNPLMIGALCFAFASALLQLFGRSGVCVSLVGSSSTGKSTILRFLQALTGSPEYLANWEATANGLEAYAAQHKDLPLIIDELGQSDVVSFGQSVYRLTNGSGKLRAKTNGGLADQAQLSTVIISAGEESPADRIRRSGQQAVAGQLARFITLPVNGQHGAFDDLHGESNGAAFSALVRSKLREVHGIAWRSFAQYVAANIPAVRRTHEEYYPGLKANIREGCNLDAADGVQERVLEHFAFAAFSAFVAINAGVLGITYGEVVDAMRRCFADALKQYQADSRTPEDEIAEEVRDLVLKHRNRLPPYSAFCDADRDTQIGFTHTVNGIDMVLLLPPAMRKVNEKYGKKAVKNALIRKGLLIPGQQGRPTSQYVVAGHPNLKPSMYALRKDAIFAG